jgi:hypothetical protein
VRSDNLPGEVVKEVVEEDHGDDTLAESGGLRVCDLLGGQGDPDGERAAHSAGGNQEQWATTDSVNHPSPEPSLKHVAHQDESVEHVLVVGAVDAEVFQDVVEVVCRQAGTGKLREHTAAHTDEDAVAVAVWGKEKPVSGTSSSVLGKARLTGCKQILPASLLFILLNGGLHLGKFKTDHGIVRITVGVILG